MRKKRPMLISFIKNILQKWFVANIAYSWQCLHCKYSATLQ